MKRFWAFTAVFLTVLLIGYLEPVFFPAEKPTETAQAGAYPALTPLFLMKNCQLLATQHT